MKKFIPTINMNKEQLNQIIKYLLITATTLIVIFSIGFFLYQNRQIISTALTVKPETFTELYFENHTHLPQKTTKTILTLRSHPTITTYYFKFTIHNLENKDMNYPYEVYTLTGNKTVIDKGNVFIKNNESKTITESFVSPNVFSQVEPSKFIQIKVVVNLTAKNQAINFWINQ